MFLLYIKPKLYPIGLEKMSLKKQRLELSSLKKRTHTMGIPCPDDDGHQRRLLRPDACSKARRSSCNSSTVGLSTPPFWALDKKGRSSKLTTKDPILGGEWLHFFEPGGVCIYIIQVLINMSPFSGPMIHIGFTPRKTNMAMENLPFESMYLLLKLVDFPAC